MMNRRILAMAAPLLLAACGGTPAEGPEPVATPLAHAVPTVGPITYASSDTARVNIQFAPGQTMEQTMAQQSTVRFAYAPAQEGSDMMVTAEFVDFTASIEAPMIGRQEVGGDAVAGEFVLSLSPEGEVEQVAGPELSEEVRQMTMGNNLFSDFFLRLPGEVVAPGTSWTDTIRSDESGEGTSTVAETIVVSTLRGDSVVDGRTYRVIESATTTSLVIEGETQGMAMRNELSGTSRTTTLWDPARRMMHSLRSTGEMDGVLSIPAAGMEDIPLDATNTRSIELIATGS